MMLDSVFKTCVSMSENRQKTCKNWTQIQSNIDENDLSLHGIYSIGIQHLVNSNSEIGSAYN